MLPRCRGWLLPLLLLAGGAVRADAVETDRVRLEVSSREITVGDRLQTTITVDLAADTRLEPARIGPRLGSFEVLSGSWSDPQEIEQGRRWVWSGELSVFETGAHEIPALTLSVEGPGGRFRVSSEPVQITVTSVLEAEPPAGTEPQISPLKPPASLQADYGPLITALVLLGILLLGAAVAWWLHRRFGHKLAAAQHPDDPFRRTPPHVWVYAELQRLLERRLAEQGQVDVFYAELSAILKQYLGGRYRLGLMEQTTIEVPPMLAQAGAPDEAIRATTSLLQTCDRVKFAGVRPEPGVCRDDVEQVYRIVDTTKPQDSADSATEKGAA